MFHVMSPLGPDRSVVARAIENSFDGNPIIENRIIQCPHEQFRLLPKSRNEGRAAAHPTQGALCLVAQLREVFRTQVGQLVLLEMAPEVLGRIQLPA